MQRTYSARKQEYFERLTGLFSNYAKCLMVTADNVGSFQMQQVRMALRGEAVVCFGKNTMMRRVLKAFGTKPGHDYKKICLVMATLVLFSPTALTLVKSQIIVENVVPAPARAGAWLSSLLLCLQANWYGPWEHFLLPSAASSNQN